MLMKFARGALATDLCSHQSRRTVGELRDCGRTAVGKNMVRLLDGEREGEREKCLLLILPELLPSYPRISSLAVGRSPSEVTLTKNKGHGHGPVRSSSVNESACHPFKAGRFLFAHNGLVGNFTQIRRELLTSLNEQLGEGMKGMM